MDELFGDGQAVDAELDFVDTEIPDAVPLAVKSALVIFPSREDRMYLRARLALAGVVVVGEAHNAAEALDQARRAHYTLVLLGQDLPDMESWELIRQLIAMEPILLGAGWLLLTHFPPLSVILGGGSLVAAITLQAALGTFLPTAAAPAGALPAAVVPPATGDNV